MGDREEEHAEIRGELRAEIRNLKDRVRSMENKGWWVITGLLGVVLKLASEWIAQGAPQ